VAGRNKSTTESNDLIGNRTSDLPAGSIVPQPTTLQRAPIIIIIVSTTTNASSANNNNNNNSKNSNKIITITDESLDFFVSYIMTLTVIRLRIAPNVTMTDESEGTWQEALMGLIEFLF
jgi:hypothetical protein